jgi:hypothetical protein
MNFVVILPVWKPLTIIMEVHHHPDLHHNKRRFTEYFLEFLMIFLAVTMGFFAESIREHYTEKTNTREYLESYRDELLLQQKMFANYKSIFQRKVIVCDSVKTIFFNHEENKKIDILERLLVPALILIDPPFNTSSYDQIVSSGALRYINNINLRDSMAAYKGLIETSRNYNSRILQSITDNTTQISKLEDFHDIVSTDTSQSYDMRQRYPVINPFGDLSVQERNAIVFFYESYIVLAQSDIRRLKLLNTTNQNVLKMVNGELEN